MVGTLVLDVVFVVHVASAVRSVLASLVSVVLVHAVGFGKLVDFSADEASQELFSELVVDSFACEWSMIEFDGGDEQGAANSPSLR